MDFTQVLQAIGTVGFPIVCCLLLFWYVNKRETSYDSKIDELTIRHSEEVSKLVEAVNNNTLVMQRLLDRLGVVDDELTK